MTTNFLYSKVNRLLFDMSGTFMGEEHKVIMSQLAVRQRLYSNPRDAFFVYLLLS